MTAEATATLVLVAPQALTGVVNRLAQMGQREADEMAGDLFVCGLTAFSGELQRGRALPEVLEAFAVLSDKLNPQAAQARTYHMVVPVDAYRHACQITRDYRLPMAELSARCVSHGVRALLD